MREYMYNVHLFAKTYPLKATSCKRGDKRRVLSTSHPTCSRRGWSYEGSGWCKGIGCLEPNTEKGCDCDCSCGCCSKLYHNLNIFESPPEKLKVRDRRNVLDCRFELFSFHPFVGRGGGLEVEML